MAEELIDYESIVVLYLNRHGLKFNTLAQTRFIKTGNRSSSELSVTSYLDQFSPFLERISNNSYCKLLFGQTKNPASVQLQVS